MESKLENEVDVETVVAYSQLAVHILNKTGTEFTPKALRNEIKMLYEKFGTKEVKRLVNIINKEKK